MRQPICTIITGPNGAGKSTFAMNYLRGEGHCHRFVNADLIATGLSPLTPEREQYTAAKLFLKEIGKCVERGESVAFETTLSGRTYIRRIEALRERGWRV